MRARRNPAVRRRLTVLMLVLLVAWTALPPGPVADSVDRLPSFITGPQPQVNGAPGGYEEGRGGERFPRRRRRPHGPRPDSMAAPAAPGEDFNPGNE